LVTISQVRLTGSHEFIATLLSEFLFILGILGLARKIFFFWLFMLSIVVGEFLGAVG